MSSLPKTNVIVIDLDGTICFPNNQYPDTERRYSQAIPNRAVIEKLKELYSKGYYIQIETARRMISYNGDLKKIEADVGEVTRKWLSEHGVLFHSLLFGKTYAMFYVDDKALIPEDFVAKEFEVAN